MVTTHKRCLLAITGAFELGGGIAAVNRLIIQALAEAGYQIEIYSLCEKKPKLDERCLSPEQASIQVFNNSKVNFTLGVWKALATGRYDFVMADLINLAAMLAPLKLVNQCRYIVWLYGIDVFPPMPDFEGSVGMKHAWKRLAISSYTREQVVNRFPKLSVDLCDLALDPVRHTVPLDLSTTNKPAEIEMTAFDGSLRALGSQFILHVGRMANIDRYKGQDTLLKAFPAISQEFPESQLVLVGEGDDMARLKMIADELPEQLKARVFMPGFVESNLLNLLYQSCYLFAMPSKGEGFGLVYLEAMSRGKPCLGGNVDATPCVIRDEVTGVLVDDPTSAEQVADKIIRLLNQPEQARTMGQKGYELVKSHYLFPHFKERFLNILAA
jgi:glycosyltransferase involved in cell wall biosynthesis